MKLAEAARSPAEEIITAAGVILTFTELVHTLYDIQTSRQMDREWANGNAGRAVHEIDGLGARMETNLAKGNERLGYRRRLLS
jgi:hypothetical protein